MARKIKKSQQVSASIKAKKFLSNKTEDFWFCVAFIVLILGVSLLLAYSMKNSQEAFVKSDYYIAVNNHLYSIQKENGTAVLISFKNKFIKKNRPMRFLLEDAMQGARNKSKLQMVQYEIMKENKNEALIKLTLNNQTEVDANYLRTCDKFV